MGVRRCPTLPRGLPRSTIGAEGLSFRVRNGTGRFPPRYCRRNSMKLSRGLPAPLCLGVWVVGGFRTVQWTLALCDLCCCGEVVGQLVPVSSTSCLASTSGLRSEERRVGKECVSEGGWCTENRREQRCTERGRSREK